MWRRLIVVLPLLALVTGAGVAGVAGSAELVVADGATAAERNAADELARYLERMGVTLDTPAKGGDARIFVGPTDRARALGCDPDAWGPEAWWYRAGPDEIVLCGGRPRGTLYAVHRFLEDRAGVRWWTPWDEGVPIRFRWPEHVVEARGTPAFAYRDVHGTAGVRLFWARRRVNGDVSGLPEAWGGRQAYGPPRSVHTFYDWLPPDRYFDPHPEYYSEVAGLRTAERAQLCASNEAVAERIAERMLERIETSRAEALAAGTSPPVRFDVSQNDWRRPCGCDACARLTREQGSRAAPNVLLLRRIAERVGAEHPEIGVGTLAYDYGLEPPRAEPLPGNAFIRFAALFQQDFAHPVRAAGNRAVLDALRGWSALTRHRIVWDYEVLFGEGGDLPRGSLHAMADDLRLYRDEGVEGLFVQLEYPLSGPMRDLRLWVLTRLLEDPALPVDGLVREFTDGFYGRAAGPVRRYLRRLETLAARREARLGFAPSLDDRPELDAAFLRRAHRRFDRAEARVADEARLLERVRRARIGLDRLTLMRGVAAEGLDLESVRRRYLAVWDGLVAERVPAARRDEAREQARREIEAWRSGRRPFETPVW